MSVPKQVPRESALASRARASGSTRSKGAGILSLRSRPLALTLLSSKAQRHGPLAPAARANPVMLLTAIVRPPRPSSDSLPIVHEPPVRPNRAPQGYRSADEIA